MLKITEELLVQYIAGSASPEERAEVVNWIKQDPDNMKLYEELLKYYQAAKMMQKPSGFDNEAGWKRVRSAYFEEKFNAEIKENKVTIRKIYLRVATAAAVIIFFTVAASIWFVYSRTSANALAGQGVLNEIVAPLGSRVQLTLSDGSSVWLNAGSKLRYPAYFTESKREVYLEGEAFFEVSKGKKLFVVKTSDLDIKVYGTKFNVKSYPDEGIIETTLVEGSLSINPYESKGREEVMLKPNQKVSYKKQDIEEEMSAESNNSEGISFEPAEQIITGQISILPAINPVIITSWKDEEWIFENEPLDELAVKLERRFNVHITFKDEGLKQYRFTGKFKDETFEQFLGILQLGAPVTYSIDKNNVTFIEDPSFKNRYDTFISKPY